MSEINAQYCVLSSNNSSSNPTTAGNFNWLAPNFPIKWADNTVNINPVTSAFFQSNNDGINYIVFGQNYSYQDGWELLQKNVSLGDASGKEISHPYMIFYNRFTGLLRAFLSVNTRGNAYQKANVELYFSNSGVTTAALSTVGYPVALTKASNKSLHSIVGAKNSPGDWFVAEFPMTYDPCTCKNYSELVFKISSTQESKLTATIATNGTLTAQDIPPPPSKKITLGNISIKDVQKLGTNALETYNSMDKFKEDLIKTNDDKWDKIGVDLGSKPVNPGSSTIALNSEIINKKANEPSKSKLDNLVLDSKTSSFLKAGLKYLPYIGAAVSVIDFFTGGGQSAGPQEVKITPMAIKMSSELTGTIVRTDPWSDIVIANPGSDQTPLNALNPLIIAERKPIYNNVMGIFSLLRTPTVEYHRESRIVPFTVRQETFNLSGTKLADYWTYNRTVYDYNFRLAEGIAQENFVVNPAHGMIIQDIQGAIIVEGNVNDVSLLGGTLGNGNVQFEYFDNTEKTYGFRTDYIDWRCIGSLVAKTSDIWSQGTDVTLPARGSNYVVEQYPYQISARRADGNMPFRGLEIDKAGMDAGKNRVFLKLMINFKRTDDPNAQNVLWVGKFPVNMREVGSEVDFNSGSALYSCQNSVSGTPFTSDPKIPVSIDQFCSNSQYLDNSLRSGRISAEIFQDWDNNGGGGGTTNPDRTENGNASDDGASNPGGEGEAQAFDNQNGTKWLVFNSTGNIAYDFANEESYSINNYTVTSANDAPDRDPKNWNLQGSNDNANWTTVDSQNNQNFGGRSETKTFNISNTTAYKQYRLNVTANNGGGLMQIAEIQMFGLAGSGGGGSCTSPTPTLSASSSTVPSTLTASGCSGTVNWATGSSGNSISVTTAGTYTATCTNPNCTVSANGSVSVTSSGGGGGSCNYADGQYLTTWFGNEVVNAYICGTKFYAKNNSGDFKSKSWLVGTGRFTTAETNCFEENDPRPGGCSGGGCTSPIPTLTASSSTVSSTLSASGCSGTVNWSTGASGYSIYVTVADTYTATCTNPTCIVSGNGSINVTNSGGSCNYTNGQFLTEWFGNEIVRAYICGTKYYAKNDAGYFKSKSWLMGTGRFTTAELDCFEEVNPGCGGSRIVAVQFEETNDKIAVYPNPTTGKIKIIFSLQKAENVWLNLYDVQGKSLILRDFEGKMGRNEMEYDLQDYPLGAYFVNFQSSEKREVLKVMKVN